MHTNFESIIEELLPTLKNIANGRSSVAITGAHAKGSSDIGSDIDFHIIVEDPKPHDEVYGMFSKIADEGTLIVTEDFYSELWGGKIDYYYKGIPVEMYTQALSVLLRTMEEAIDGKFEIIPQVWTTNGYYTYIMLSEVYYMQPLWDPTGIVAELKAKVAVYPEKLREAIIGTFFERANTWIDNFHYHTAFARGDYMYTVPIIVHTVMDMVQVIFAINRVYFPGDKKLMKSLSQLSYCPAALLENMEFLYSASTDAGVLQRQCDILREVRDELRQRIS